MLIIGTHFFSWGSETTSEGFHCGKCGHFGPFVMKKGMRFLTLFFIIPVIPLSGIKHMIQCPHCSTKFQAMASAAAA
jgi:hypothetical protein